MQLIKYIIKRLIETIPLLIIVSLISFFIIRLAPIDPIAELRLNPSISQETLQKEIKRLNLDKPILVQYLSWGKSFLKGNLGYTTSGEKVSIKFGQDKVSIDRSESGLMTDHKHFADVVVAASLSLCDGKDGYDVDIYVDVASIELFVDGGRIAMTDIVFPNLPYSQFSIGCLNGEALMGNLKLYELK